MSLKAVINFSGIWILFSWGVFNLWALWFRQRRRRLFREFAEKYGLSSGQSSTAVDPRIKGRVFEATYPLWLEGVFQGVSVVAFDYGLGSGQDHRVGSGVGVRKQIFHAGRLAPAMNAIVQDEWTFLYTPIRLLLSRGLNPAEMESLWVRLLHAPTASGTDALSMDPIVPGGLHIPPKSNGKQGSC